MGPTCQSNSQELETYKPALANEFNPNEGLVLSPRPQMAEAVSMGSVQSLRATLSWPSEARGPSQPTSGQETWSLEGF